MVKQKTLGKVSLRMLVRADSRYRFNRSKIRKAVLELLNEKGIRGDVELSLMVVGDRKIRDLKLKHLGVDQITDVLSFPQLSKGFEVESVDVISKVIPLGDVVVCYPQAKRQAIKLNRLLDDEIEFLVCHGVLHLLGVHHN